MSACDGSHQNACNGIHRSGNLRPRQLGHCSGPCPPVISSPVRQRRPCSCSRISCIAMASSWATGSGSPESPAKLPGLLPVSPQLEVERSREERTRSRAWGGGGPGGTRGHGAVRSGRRRSRRCIASRRGDRQRR